MKILMIGSGKGSWQVRGMQLGGALGARVRTRPTADDLMWADVVVLIKRADPKWAMQAHDLRKPVVWDALDFWQQPEQNALTEPQALGLLREHLARYRPTLTIGATEAMAKAVERIYLPHHARTGLSPAPVCDVVTTVAYEGSKKYLGRWSRAVKAQCQQRGWRFVINPPDLSEADLVVAFRDDAWDGWMCREWKSGVKIVNAIAAGRPIISQPCAAMDELTPAGTVVSSPDDLGAAFDQWTERAARVQTVRASSARWSTFSLAAVSGRYRAILQQVAEHRPVREMAVA